MDKVYFDVEIIDGECSVQCIHALQQVMDKFTAYGLSINGRDKRAVYMWFKERYDPSIGPNKF